MSATGTIESGRLAAGTKGLGRAFMRAKVQVLFDWIVAFWIFTGGMVFIEPSPYEVSFVLVLPIAFMAGMGLHRSTFGLFAIMIGFTPFALIGAFQARVNDVSDSLIFVIVTIFLLFTAYFVANYVAENTEKRMRIVIGAYTAAAVFSALLGTLAYLGLLPSADTFLLYGRAKAMFKDPNVFGPFLILPAMYALQRVLLGKGPQVYWAVAVYMVIFVGIFASFSRAAWGHFAVSSLLVLALCFWLEARAHEKVRIMIISLVGAAMLVVAIAGLLSIPSVSDLFATRAAGQEYDSGESGRFGRQGYAFDLALNNPLGLGPGEFSQLRIREEPHNVYVNVLHAYGWGGGAMYYLLIVLTLWRGFASLARPSPFRPMMIPLMATFPVLVLESAIIDTDHWRHWFLIAGLIWGISTAIGNSDRSPNRPRGVMV